MKRIEALRESFQWTGNWHVAIEESRLLAEQGLYAEALTAVGRAKSLYNVRFRGSKVSIESDETAIWENYLRRQQESSANSN